MRLGPVSAAAALAVAGLGCATGDANDPSPAQPTVERFHRWSPRLAQGAEPTGDAAFADLAARGFKVIVSVDGKPPEVAAAARHGLRYVHLPIGYDGIGRERQLQIVKAVTDAEGPIYIHCHHGRHRGPAAAALARVARDGVTTEVAVRDLATTCSPRYAGLFKSVRSFQVPSRAELETVAELPSVVRPSDPVEAMLTIEETWGHLRALRDAGWSPLADLPDLDPPHEALMLEEAFRELARLPDAALLGKRFVGAAEDAAGQAAELSAALRAADATTAGRAFDGLKQRCSTCHERYRNQ